MPDCGASLLSVEGEPAAPDCAASLLEVDGSESAEVATGAAVHATATKQRLRVNVMVTPFTRMVVERIVRRDLVGGAELTRRTLVRSGRASV